MNPQQPPTQLRVHGVGGPQARKMLGLLHDEDVVTISLPRTEEQRDEDDGSSLPAMVPATYGGDTRFARRVDRCVPEECGSDDDVVEAYEWGGLTTGSFKKALWVLYLPLTVMNAAGWAHGWCHDGDEVPVRIRLHQWLAHLLSATATVTYVAWMAYIALDLVAVRWRTTGMAHFRTGIPHGVFDTLVPALAIVVLLGAVGALGAAIASSKEYEKAGARYQHSNKWKRVPAIGDRSFYAHPAAYRRLLIWHGAVAVAMVAGALAQYAVGWNRLGLVIIAIAMVQTLLLVPFTLLDLLNRFIRPAFRPGQPPSYAELDGVWRPGPRLPVGGALAVIGIALTHSALSALAATVRSLLARWPAGSLDLQDAIPVHAELGASDILIWALALSAAFLIVQAAVAAVRRSPVVVTMARQGVLAGTLVALAVAIPTGVYIWLNGRSILRHRHGGSLGHGLHGWYDTYAINSRSFTQSLGQGLLLAIPPILWAVLSHPHDTGVARVIGNIWDVLTFWPRRFQPFAVPCTAERAVPELRERIVQITTDAAVRELVVVAHSQGSVLAAAAIGSVSSPDPCGGGSPEDESEHLSVKEKVRLVTFGSPLGSLYTPTWPAYILPLTDVVARPDGELRQWMNFWRKTDPIGASVPDAANVVLCDPREPSLDELARAGCRVPGERPLRSTQAGGHSSYLTDPRVYAVIEQPWAIVSATPLPDPDAVRLPAMRWAHQGGACEGPSNTIAAMRRALSDLGGANALEMDVHLTADNVVVVSHDGMLGKRTDKIGRIATTALEDIQTADAAYWFRPAPDDCDCDAEDHTDVPVDLDPSAYELRADPATGPGWETRIPTLDEVLTEFPSTPLTIEIKRVRAARQTVDAVLADDARQVAEGRPAEDTRPVTVTALFGYRLGPARRCIKELDIEWITLAPGLAYLVWFRLRVALRLPPSRSNYARIQLPVRKAGIRFVRASVVDAAHAAGMAVDFWTINDEATMEMLIDLGVDGIMTDRPSVLAAVCDRRVPEYDLVT